MWKPGDVILVRNVARGRIWGALAVTVVADSPELLAFYWAAGYPRKSVAATRDRFAELWYGDGFAQHVDVAWTYTNVLCLVTPGTSHSTWLTRRAEDDTFLGWYVNLEKPLVRTDLGFDTTDLQLDVVIQPDHAWRWKDEDEFALDIEHGFISMEEAAAIRAEGERVIAKALNREPPFDGTWLNWRPDPAWSTPSIPEGWDTYSDRR